MQHEYDEYLKAVCGFFEDLGWRLRPPCPEEEIEDLRCRSRYILNAEIPEQYADFLRITNGLRCGDLNVHGSKQNDAKRPEYGTIYGFVEMTTFWREELEYLAHYMFFAENSISWYTYNLSTRQYELLDNTCSDVMDVFPSFDALLTRAFKDSLDIEDLKTPLPDWVRELARSGE
jgi:hypothetical protein